jgi:hypothetical protein
MVLIADLTPASRAHLRLVPSPPPRGEVCVLLDPGQALVWLHGAIDSDLADDLVDAATDLVDAGLPVTIRGAAITSCDGTVLQLVGRLVTAGLPVRIVDPTGRLRRALHRAVHLARG